MLFIWELSGGSSTGLFTGKQTDSNPGPTVASSVVGSPEVQLPKGNGPLTITILTSTQGSLN